MGKNCESPKITSACENERFLKQEDKRSVARDKRTGLAGHYLVFIPSWENLAPICFFFLQTGIIWIIIWLAH